MLSSAHTPEMVESGKLNSRTKRPIMKPKCISDYNLNMGAVDKVDMQINFSEYLRKTIKWYKKLFFHFLDLSVYNAYVLYKVRNPGNIQLLDFKMQVIRAIFETYGSQRPIQTGRPPNDPPLRLTARHFASIIPQTKLTTNPQRKCVVCNEGNVNKGTRYECKDCDVGLCLHDCFKIYHTQKNF